MRCKISNFNMGCTPPPHPGCRVVAVQSKGNPDRSNVQALFQSYYQTKLRYKSKANIKEGSAGSWCGTDNYSGLHHAAPHYPGLLNSQLGWGGINCCLFLDSKFRTTQHLAQLRFGRASLSDSNWQIAAQLQIT